MFTSDRRTIVYWFDLWNRLQKRLFREWKTVPEDEAKRSRYYGFWGWLLFFYILAVNGLSANLLFLFGVEDEARQLQLEAYGGNVSLLQGVLLIHSALTIPFLVLAPLKHRLMPKLWIWCIWIALFVGLAAPEKHEILLWYAAAGVPTILLLTWYILNSKRVGATYLSRVPLKESPKKKAHKKDIPFIEFERRAKRNKRIFWVLAAIFGVVLLLAQIATYEP